MKPPCRLSLVVPTLNEGATIQALLRQLVSVLDEFIPGSYELWVVDDNSTDNTQEQVRTVQSLYPQIQLLQRLTEKGLASAAIAGWHQAQGEILGVIDADLQHPPKILPSLLQEIDAGADLAIASRYTARGQVERWSRWRQVASRFAAWLGLMILPRALAGVRDPMSGFFVVRRSAIADCNLKPMGYKVLLEILVKGHIHRIKEVGYRFDIRQGGRSKVSWQHAIVYVVHLLRLRFS
ncbi:MAG: polyprenol monophosphomannose synthase [Synechococcus sp.]